MKLRTKKKTAPLVGVDVDARSVAGVQVDADGRPVKVGVEPLPPGAFRDGEIVDGDVVSGVLRDLVDRHGLAKQVRLGVANQRVAFRTVRLPVIEDPDQLQAAVRFQAQEQIPMPLDSAVLDHQVIGGVATEDGNQQIDVAVVAARRDSVSTLVGATRAAGLEPAGVDLAAFGMIRALAGSPTASNGEAGGDDGEFVQAELYCSLGDLTNLAIARQRACVFSRVAQFSVQEIAEGLSAETGLPGEHAEQWLLHTGLSAPVEQIEGDASTVARARAALEAGATRIADELRLSLDYYGSQDGAFPVGDVVLCGWGSAIPGLAERLGEELGRVVVARTPAILAPYGDAEASRLTVAYGLALEH